MGMGQLSPPTQICSMYEINLQCGDQILKSMIMQQDIILDWCFITGLYDSYCMRNGFETKLPTCPRIASAPTFISFKGTLVNIFWLHRQECLWERTDGTLFRNIFENS